jgi:hypothetical protein
VWKISDFVTLGSPLTHADFVLAPTKEKFGEAATRREYPLCPPFFEPNMDKHDDHDLDEVFSFRPVGEKKSDPWFPHHAAVFAPVRWTNLYNNHAYLIFGDIISGPVAGLFGNGVADVQVKMGRRLFTHNAYWTWRPAYESPKMLPDHIQIMRDALNLRDDGDPVMKWLAD